MNFNSPDDCIELVSQGIDEQERMVVLVAKDRYENTRRTLIPLLNSRDDICGFRNNPGSDSYYFKNGSAIHIMSDVLPKHRIRGLGQNRNIIIGSELISEDVLAQLYGDEHA